MKVLSTGVPFLLDNDHRYDSVGGDSKRCLWVPIDEFELHEVPDTPRACSPALTAHSDLKFMSTDAQ
jgi:hypothetical protein